MDDIMERPTKRPRLSLPPGSPEETSEWDLQTARTQNDLRLKSIFEGIFSKYGNDFTEVGDEIDLETGEIVVNNGHLQGLLEENSPQDNTPSWLFGTDLSKPESDIAQDEAQDGVQDELKDSQYDPSTVHPRNELSGFSTDGDTSVDSLLDTALAFDTKTGIPRSNPTGSKDQYALDPPEKDPGPTDPLWQAPELPSLFSTPTAERRRNVVQTPRLPHITREVSPPGSGSLWTVPRRGRPRKDGQQKATPSPSKSRSRAKRKPHSSPAARDWSFAKVTDGDESDDPLQEDFPSYTPSRSQGTEKKFHTSPQLKLNIRVESRCQSPSPADPALHGQSASGLGHGPRIQGHHSEESHVQSEVAPNVRNFQCDSPAPPHCEGKSDSPQKSTSARSRGGVTPDEAKVIVCMRYVQKRKWKDILDFLPGRKMPQIIQWNAIHWTDRRANPPEVSTPWSETELNVLDALKDRSDLSWSKIQTELPGRSRREIEIELFRLWVGNDVWGGTERNIPSKSEATIENREQSQKNDASKSSESSVTAVKEKLTVIEPLEIELLTPRTKRRRQFEDFLEDDDDDDLILINDVSSPSKMSAICLNTPSPSRSRSATPRRASPVKRLKLGN
ncbi:hypothetical protein N7462_000601 [Penicillium macrosclerotiorum]|uniref:uncharacterized protein n=1 Tax=Penicillium macrosclerotiorum TaxID=303699 RepID=UPI002547EC46|nr:uncharacterized protein N7462_000601 [Penicillium macrosclerotiorum]KAJ5698596.1 hypothetical protein N7462_000601 [Penicillium macrosclerotiorum]